MAMLYSRVFILYLVAATVSKVSSQESQGQQTVWICENDKYTITCNNKQPPINIISAFYGRSGNGSNCLSSCYYWCSCSSDVTTTVRNMCNGRFFCQINNNNDVFGDDPCIWAPKFLRITYSCDNVATTPMVTTAERTTSPKTTITAAATFTTAGESFKTTGSTTPSRTTTETKSETTTTTTTRTEVSINTAATTLQVTTDMKGNAGALGGDGQASKDNTVIIAAVVASVAIAVIVAGIVGLILWKKRKTPDSSESPSSEHNNIYDNITSNIHLTNTGATYRTDGNCNPSEQTNIADLYAKPNKKKSAPNVDQLYAKPMKKKPNVSDVDQLYAKPKKSTGASNIPCDNELDNEDEGSVDNMLYESTGNITFTTKYTADNEEGYVDNELYGSTA